MTARSISSTAALGLFIGNFSQFRRMFWVSTSFNRWGSEADDLDVVAEPVHHAETNIEIDHRRDAQGAHFYAAFRQLAHPVIKVLRKNMAEDIDLHRTLFRKKRVLKCGAQRNQIPGRKAAAFLTEMPV